MPHRTIGQSSGSGPERRDVYERLADELRRDIVSGRHQPGDRLPSTLDLMAKTGVANLTVRGAYRVLVEDGLVEPVAKKGFYVCLAAQLAIWRDRQPMTGIGAATMAPTAGAGENAH